MRDIQERRLLAAKPSVSSSASSQDQGSEQHGAANSNVGSNTSSTSGPLSSSQRPCRSCGGTGRVVCPACDASGIQLIEL
jgi:DnaJ-class molecular chaperone